MAGFRVLVTIATRNVLFQGGRSHGEKLSRFYSAAWTSSQCVCSSQISHDSSRRWLSTTSTVQVPEQTVSLEQKVPSLKRKILDMLGLTGKMRHNRFKMRITGLRIYTSCVSNIDIQTFIKVCNLPDTFFSWFLITQLHVWMCMVRLRKEGKEGKYILHYLVLAMWHDVQQRGTVLGVNSVKMRESLRQMLEIFQGMLFAYDEGLMSNDRVLAGALWRNVFCKKCDDPQHLENMVAYVRKQVQYLDTLDAMFILKNGSIEWLPFTGHIPVRKDVLKNPSSSDPLELPTYTDKITVEEL